MKAIDGERRAGLWRHCLDQHDQPFGAGSGQSAENPNGFRVGPLNLAACHRDSPAFLSRLIAGESLIFWNGCTRSGIAPNNPADVLVAVERVVIIVRPFAARAAASSCRSSARLFFGVGVN